MGGRAVTTWSGEWWRSPFLHTVFTSASYSSLLKERALAGARARRQTARGGAFVDARPDDPLHEAAGHQSAVPLFGIALLEICLLARGWLEDKNIWLHAAFVGLFLAVAHVAMIFGMLNPFFIMTATTKIHTSLVAGSVPYI